MTTYSQLKLEIQTFLNITDQETINSIPNFIHLAEQQIFRDCKNIGLVDNVLSASSINQGGFIIGSNIIAKPIGWRNPISFTNFANSRINTMEIRSVEFINMYWPDESKRGIPIYYAEQDINYLKVAPVPDNNYPYQLAFRGNLPPLSESNQSNWLTNFIPDILFYCSLIKAMLFLKNDERLPAWKEEYLIQMNALNVQDVSRINDKSSNREAD